MKKLIFICFTVSLLLLGCSKDEIKKVEPVTSNEVEVIITGTSESQQITLVTEQSEQDITGEHQLKIEENTLFSLKITDGKKTFSIDNLLASPDTKIDLSGYQFNLDEVTDVISRYGIEHSRAMAWKDMTQWTTVTENYLTSAQGDYINETLYEGQLKQIYLDLDSFKMSEPNKLNVQTQLVFEEMYYLTEEVESLHKGHSHGNDDPHGTKEIVSVNYTIDFSLIKQEDGWKVDKIDFPTTSNTSDNVWIMDIDAEFFSPTEKAKELAQYYLDYKQISIFLEEFFAEYVKALNFKNIDYISAYTTGKTIFEQKISEQPESVLVELLDIHIISMDTQSENLYKWNVELLLQVNGEEKLEQYDFYVKSNNDQYLIMSE